VLTGKVITELNGSGQKHTGYVYLGQEVLAIQVNAEASPPTKAVIWRHEDPVTGARGTSSSFGYAGELQPDPEGVDVGFSNPYNDPPAEPQLDLAELMGGSVGSGACRLDGVEIDCALAGKLMRMESAVQCPNNDCGPRRRSDGTLSQPFQAFGDGWAGFLPQGAIYDGNGGWFIYGHERDDPHGKRRKIRPENGNYGMTFGGDLNVAAQQKSACGQFVDTLISRIAAGGIQSSIGRAMMGWAKFVIHPNSQAGVETFDGFRQMYTDGGQNAGALVHIAGVAGAKLVGGARLYDPLSSDPYETGDQRARKQYVEDVAQLREGITYRDAGYKTLANPYNPNVSVIRGYLPTHLVEDYIKEKQAEIADDEAGVQVGNMLGQFYAGNNSRSDTRAWIFNLLCDH